MVFFEDDAIADRFTQNFYVVVTALVLNFMSTPSR